MLALITAVVLAQSSVGLNIGGKPKMTDSAARVERERKQDSSRLRYEIWRDSLIAARSGSGSRGDSVDRKRRKAKLIAVTPALMSNAFKDARARELLASARLARLSQDSSITGY